MKKTALVLGFGVLMVSLFCLDGGEPVSPKANECKERYKMFSPPVSSGGMTEIYVIDSQTGRIWKQTFFTDIKGFYMVPQPYLTADQLAVSATPPEGESLETLSLQKRYEREVERVRQKSAESKPTPPNSP
jgi:hypothetical protein